MTPHLGELLQCCCLGALLVPMLSGVVGCGVFHSLSSLPPAAAMLTNYEIRRNQQPLDSRETTDAPRKAIVICQVTAGHVQLC